MTPMQRLLQLPVSAVNMVKTVQGPPEEAKSPVLTPDNNQATWYSAVQPDELRHLRPTGEGEEPPPQSEDGTAGPLAQSQPLRNDDLKVMLDSNKDAMKLEAMKRIITMMSRGKNASDLFPAVVKNVACKNIEVKKLVYVYLVRYAEEKQDLALLSISTFQRGLKDPNQLIRASALRVLSSVRVTIIVPIMMLAIKEAASDMSPYVRKTAAHAIPKLYSLDPDLKEQLIEVIEKLLADKTTLVAGSVVMAFEEVCPDRIDLIHKNFRKLCNLLVDVEEWGQVVIINMLTRYSRTQFLNPNANDTLMEETDEKVFYASDEEDGKDNKGENEESDQKAHVMDPDHRLLLRNTKPLLQSRNAAVVMSVAQLYFHLAPKAEVVVIAKALVRLLRSHSEVQFVVLQNVATMTIKRKGMFEPYLKSFYIRSTDPTQIKILKLEVLTNLANETNISVILREFQAYITSMDKDFVAASIQAIGRCATNIGEVREPCLNGLVQLMSNRDELVVAESVVVIKKLLQMQPEHHNDIIKHMAKLTDNIQVPMARASILWLIGEYCEHVPKIAPDVLRKTAKTFTSEDDIVKLQILNLAAKLYVTNSKQTKLLTQYVLNLAKYDQNYDIRDRARFIRQLVVPTENCGALSKYAKKLFLALKPAPVFSSPFKDRDQYQLGSLSHLLNTKAFGYQELPEWPEEAPDPTVRNVELEETISNTEGRIGLLGEWREAPDWSKTSEKKKKKEKKAERAFYSDSEGEYGPTESANSGSSKGSGSESASRSGSDSEDSGSGSESEESERESGSEEEEKKVEEKSKRKPEKVKSKKAAPESAESEQSDREERKTAKKKSKEPKSESESELEESSSESSGSDSDKESDTEAKSKKTVKPTSSKVSEHPKQEEKQVSLLDLDDFAPKPSNQSSPVHSYKSNSLVADLEGLSLSDSALPPPTISLTLDSLKTHVLLHRLSGEGLAVDYCFSRQPFGTDPHMITVQLQLTNNMDVEAQCLHIEEPRLQSGMRIKEFLEIDVLQPGKTVTVVMGIDFCDSTQAANFLLCSNTRKFSVSIQPPVGELLMPSFITEHDFKKRQGQLAGMNEIKESLTLSKSCKGDLTIMQRVTSVANLGRVSTASDKGSRFAGKTVSSGSLVLVTVETKTTRGAQLTINSEKMVIGAMLVKDVLQALSQ
ncbi:LOW QUALITY PROTEIN: AP-3 complex subunit beta-2-like [Brienomyrus brachyistius]|uniref:LOW QUALITY PROTEIN: AP-3 complex subunit beta-2-like n=1 Tax=Brienomyrus brachyistius TaxID=42636 RepID=UPI0020B431B3|nr:LOW QUALITY PROTEIN: AP-3 complex subunit beta-2-like [Brienomyrus brachyistius]